MSGNTNMLIVWINQISKDDNRKGAYKVDKNKPYKLISLGSNCVKFQGRKNSKQKQQGEK